VTLLQVTECHICVGLSIVPIHLEETINGKVKANIVMSEQH